ncbi:TetR/AcrR family transcriptional regulator [Alkalibacterium subtropicum]|uniref:TetR/AcrR family transcriptional regulator n=1 Tax=Alkalibacterium subtropicum TaxID=753702 RepID=UPI000B8A58F4|nr:TetR/AcrR family transcriptional regulator [Alkalibacterium subtropicum]
MKEHILEAALELMKDEGFQNFTARRIAEYLNASTQPIYKEFDSMDHLRENLLEYVKENIRQEVFKGTKDKIDLVSVCANYIHFAKKEATLFCALFMGRDYPVRALHACALDSLNQLMNDMEELEDHEERRAFLDIIWPSIHGTAVLTAQGQLEYDEQTINEKAEHIVTHSLAAWKQSKIA